MCRWWHGRLRLSRGSAGAALAPGGEVDRLEARAVGQAWDPAALGDRCPVDDLDVAGEVDGRGAADVRPDGVRVDPRSGLLEVGDPFRVEATRDHDLHVGESSLIKPRADLLDQLRGHPSA